MASGFLELEGFGHALISMDAMCKAANITVLAVDANNPANEKTARVPVSVQVKISGGVADVQQALEAGRRAAVKYLPDELILTHSIPSDNPALQGLLVGGKLPPKQATAPKKKLAALGVLDVQCYANAVKALNGALQNSDVTVVDVKKYLGGRMVTILFSGTVAAAQAAVEQAKTEFGSCPCLKSAMVITNPHAELFRFIG